MIFCCLALAVTLSAGCKSKEQKILEESLALHEQALTILNDNVGDPNKAVQQLLKLEADSRDQRKALRAQGKEALDALDEEERKAFFAESSRRYEEMAARFATVLKRYDAGTQPRLQQLLSQITR